MNRFHVHVTVPSLDQGIAFYSQMFGLSPAVTKDDYAKWMLEDPRLNFAISTRRATAGINHLGLQVDSEAELSELKVRAQKADRALIDEPDAACCYALSNKHWITDPAGVAWEIFHTLGEIPVFGEDRQEAAEPAKPAASCGTEAGGACCA